MSDTVINTREEFTRWAMERANHILVEQGSELATASRSGDETDLTRAANHLGQAIVDALVEVFDELIPGEPAE